MIVHSDCRHFRGDIPCAPHKARGVHCEGCPDYDPIRADVLIIKLGALGDVIRTTPILSRVSAEYPASRIWWLTDTPEVLPPSVDRPLSCTPGNLDLLRSVGFDLVLSLDKDHHACAMASSLTAKRVKGFVLGPHGTTAPADDDARAKWMTGVFDDVSRANTLSYPQEIFAIAGWTFSGEPYAVADPDPSCAWPIDQGHRVVGINTGCGSRWTSREIPDTTWKEVIRLVRREGMEVVLLGGPAEADRNVELASVTGSSWFGAAPLSEFFSLVKRCDAVVTGITMALHATIAMGTRVVAINNIFNPNEFELYGLGTLLEPSRECRCYFSARCTNPDYCCLDYLEPGRIAAAAVAEARRAPAR